MLLVLWSKDSGNGPVPTKMAEKCAVERLKKEFLSFVVTIKYIMLCSLFTRGSPFMYTVCVTFYFKI